MPEFDRDKEIHSIKAKCEAQGIRIRSLTGEVRKLTHELTDAEQRGYRRGLEAAARHCEMMSCGCTGRIRALMDAPQDATQDER